MAFSPTPKKPGDLIRSQDWNDALDEVVRLEAAKLNLAGGTINGPLSVTGTLGVGSATAPNRALTVRSAAGTYLNVIANNGTHEILLGADSTGGIVSTMTNHDLQLRAGGNVTRITVKADGKIGIGTPSPGEPLEVNGRIKSGALTIGPWPANPSGYTFLGTNALNQGDPANYALLQGSAAETGVTFLNSPTNIRFRIKNADKMVLENDGHLRVLADSNPVHFTAGWTGYPDASTNQAEISNDTGTYKTLMIVGNRSAGIGRRVSVWDRLEVNGPLVVQQAHTIKIGISSPAGGYGNDGIRGEPNLWLDAAGTVFIKQGFQARGMDVAERFKTREPVHAGQVVIFDEPAEAVKLCDRAYDSRVIGIASAEPAFILGIDPEQIPIALCGRVPCQVDADIAPIAVGDLLTTSPTRGHAQKITEPDKAVGAIIGKALASLESGKGKIPVLVLLH